MEVSPLEQIHDLKVATLMTLSPEDQEREIRQACRSLVESGQFACLELLAERIKTELFSTLINTREEAVLHEVRGMARGVEDLMSSVFAECAATEKSS